MLLELKVARAWQVPPTKLREWSQEDRTLAAALLAHEADIGPCGYPHRVTTDPELDGWIEVDTDNEPRVCVVCASLDRHRADSSSSREPGELVSIIDRRREMTDREEPP